QVLGETDAEFIVRDDAVFLALGAGRRERLKECLSAVPKGVGPQVYVQLNPVRYSRALETVGGGVAAKKLPAVVQEGRIGRGLHGSVEGGAALRVTYRTHLLGLIRFVAQMN